MLCLMSVSSHVAKGVEILKSPLWETLNTHNDSTTSREELYGDGGTCWRAPWWSLRLSIGAHPQPFQPWIDLIISSPNWLQAAPAKCAGSPFGSLCQGVSQGLDSWVGSKHITGFVAFGSAPFCSCQGCFSLIPVHISKMERGAFSSCHTWWWHCSGLELASYQQGGFVPTETQENWPGGSNISFSLLEMFRH